MKKTELINFLNDFLKIDLFSSIDNSKNGLQVDTYRKEIKKIGYAVDATSYIFDLAIENQVDLILTHHGIFWGFETTLIDIYYERISKLIKNNIGLYASHLPLDAHPVVGNNIGLLIGLLNSLYQGEYKNKVNKILQDFEKNIDNILSKKDDIIYEDDNIIISRFGKYKGIYIGYGIRFKKDKFHWTQLISPYADIMQLEKKFYNFGEKEFFDSVAIVSGGAGELVNEAKNKKYDIYLTGEAVHWQITFAKEIGQSIFLAGHRETEKIGPKLLSYYLKKKFDLQVLFLDKKY